MLHLVPYLTDSGYSRGQAAFAFSTIGLAGLLSKPFWGVIVERVPTRYVASAEFVLLGVGITFSCIALIFNALAKGYDFFTYYFTLFLTPMMFLSGIFFPTTQLPPLVRSIAEWLPLTAAVELVRPLFMDQWPVNPWRHALVLLTCTVVAFWVALALTRKRFRS